MLIALTGVARAGKDSAANMLVARYGFTKLGFADGVREMAAAIDPYVHTGQNRHFTDGDTSFARYSEVLAQLGYEDAKQCADVRRLLQRIGTEAGRAVFGDNAWVALTSRRIYDLENNGQTNVVIADCRFPNEAEMVRALSGFVVRVERPGYDNGLAPTHPSESLVAGLKVDATITATNLDELYEDTEQVYAKLREVYQSAGYDAAIYPSLPTPAVYLAGPWSHKPDAIVAKAALIAAGINVVSTWTEQDMNDQDKPDTFPGHAQSDWNELCAANTFVILNLDMSEDKASELGGALMASKRVILVGKRERNIFYHLPQVEQVETLDEAIALLRG